MSHRPGASASEPGANEPGANEPSASQPSASTAPNTLLGTLLAPTAHVVKSALDAGTAGLDIALSGLEKASNPAAHVVQSALDTGTAGLDITRSGLEKASNPTAHVPQSALGAGTAGIDIARLGLEKGSNAFLASTAHVTKSALDAGTAGIDIARSELEKGTNAVLTPTAHIAQSALGAGTAGLDIARSGLEKGSNAVLSSTAHVAQSALDATTAGISIGTHIARSGFDMGSNVVSGTASLTGTALGAVVAAASETSGAVFQPVTCGLKALEGLNHLGEHGVQAINGLSLDAVRKVSELTKQALNMSGKMPTLFDPDADGVVRVLDTVRGLGLLGLNEKIASYAAYALHAVFSYPTSDSWVPSFDATLPIHVDKLTHTRWGKNWGKFERLEWVTDVEIDKFFAPRLTNVLTLGRQGFGILLIIFEWGTTWPFYIPRVPMTQIPFADDIGSVVRKAILPTIASNFKKAHAANPEAQNPAPPANEEPINMPGEFAG